MARLCIHVIHGAVVLKTKFAIYWYVGDELFSINRFNSLYIYNYCLIIITGSDYL